MTEANKKQARIDQLKKAAQQSWDIIIIGGGITGAGIFRQASLDGYKTLLIEQDDFASGTSCGSSKLIHGGLRYLEQYNFSLVAESIAEKSYLLQYAPDLVTPLPFMFPVYKQDRRPLWMIHLGTWIYALLAHLRSTPTRFSKHKLLAKIPQLKAQGLRGGVLYQDAQTIDTQLTLSSILSGYNDHSVAINHCQCVDLIEQEQQVSGIEVKDMLSDQRYRLQGKWIINATGPWKHLPYKKNVSMIYSKGSHLVIQGNPFGLTSALTMFSPDDGRVMFCIPWLGHTLVGTTDEPTTQKPDHVTATAEEVSYIQATLAHYFPQTKDYTIVSTFAALRTLIGDKNKKLSALKRDHQIDMPKQGLLQVYGGKLTAFTKIALDVMHAIQQRDQSSRSKRHAQTFATVHNFQADTLTHEQIELLIEDEMACTVADILARRTSSNLLLEDHGQRHIPAVTTALQKHFDYTDEEINLQIKHYQSLCNRPSSSRSH